MEKTTIADDVMKSLGEMLSGVSDASIKRYAATLSPMRKTEQSLGSLHSEETKRLFVLALRLDSLSDQAKAKIGLVETNEERDAETQAAARYLLYCKLARIMAWCQIHEDIGGFWNDNTGVREDWVVVREDNDPINKLKASLEKAFGAQAIIGQIDIQREGE